jgi:Acetyltransferase (GNAT) domain
VALDGERLAGFSAALARGDSWFLSALFVLPQYQGRRVGRELLDRSWAGEYGARMTITDSIQPVSTGMYARRGLIPTTPIFSVSGSPTADLPPDLEAVVPEPEALAALDHDKRRPSRCRRSWPAGNHSMRRFTCRAARADCSRSHSQAAYASRDHLGSSCSASGSIRLRPSRSQALGSSEPGFRPRLFAEPIFVLSSLRSSHS